MEGEVNVVKIAKFLKLFFLIIFAIAVIGTLLVLIGGGSRMGMGNGICNSCSL